VTEETLHGTAPDLSEESEYHFSVLYQGPTKSGKTHAALSWPKPFAILWDKNMATARKFGFDPLAGAGNCCAPRNWDEFEKQILPKIRRREIAAETIVFDSYSFAAGALRTGIQGTRDKLPIAGWGTVFDKLVTATNEIAAVCNQKGGYHFVATVHNRDTYDDEGQLVKVDPGIQGQFKDWLARFFDTVLITSSVLEKVRVDDEVVRRQKYFCYTVPPSEHYACGDGVGGGGKYNVLPPQVEGTYKGLMEGWGIK